MNSLNRKESIMQELENSIEKGELSLVYQPQIHSKDKKIIGIEALARWTNDTFGSVPPNEFIQYAEENGFIIKLGQYILEEAIKTAIMWLNKGYNFGKMAVNASALELAHPDYLNQLLALCDQYELPCSYVEIEITESIHLYSVKNSLKMLRNLIRHGIQVTLDDYGIGYANFSTLIEVDFSLLKVDKSIIDTLHRPKTQLIMESFIEMSAKIGCHVLAEGVETEKQVETLKELGCYLIQGYHYSKPVTFCSMDSMLERAMRTA